jgi:peptidoglycan/LPS O-acetylase OafA/YrhL
VPSDAGPIGTPTTRRLHFLDGLRAVAAFYVLLFHEFTGDVVGHGDLSRGMNWLQALLYRGHFSVVIFIVLSGFSLMLPIARASSGRLESGMTTFFRRRARRILPPYYAALALSCVFVAVQNVLGSGLGLGKPVEGAALTPGSIVSHLLLLHNLTYQWVYRINGPLWSVATEWQIYFVFALLLLPLYRRVGLTTTVAFAWVVGAFPFFAFSSETNLWWACPWFVGSFALGMAGAVIAYDKRYETFFWRRVPWGLTACGLLLCVVVVIATGRIDIWSLPSTDLLVSLFAFAWINAMVQQSSTPGRMPGAVLRLLSSKPLVYLGGFSYSLYLVQFPLVRLAERLLVRLPLSYDAILAGQLLLVTPVVIALAWVFSELFERPFTTGGVLLPLIRRRLEHGTSASPSPAL